MDHRDCISFMLIKALLKNIRFEFKFHKQRHFIKWQLFLNIKEK